MKSTGLFGKNSGRVGGVVYSNYRGEQVVRAYQPKVSNPNSAKQIAQRAKFKLVSQVGASLGKEIKMSYIPNVAKENPRNAFVKDMLKKTIYANNKATLPIEDIVLTNSKVSGFVFLQATNQQISGQLHQDAGNLATVRVVFIGYNEGGDISVLSVQEKSIANQGELKAITIQVPSIQGYTNIRALAYVYEPDTTSGTSYEDYEMLGDEATLQEVLRVFSGRVIFSATENISIPQNV